MKTIYLVNVLEIWIGLQMKLVRLYENIQRRGNPRWFNIPSKTTLEFSNIFSVHVRKYMFYSDLLRLKRHLT